MKDIYKIENNRSSETDILLYMREDQMKFLQLIAPTDIAIKDFRQTLNEQNKATKNLMHKRNRPFYVQN